MPLKVNKGKQPKPRRILLYGMPGVGKSTFAAQAPGVIFMPLEEGINDLDVDSLDQPRTFREFQEQIKALMTEQHDYQWLAIDTLNQLERLIHQHICALDGSSSIEHAQKGYGRGYKMALREMSDVLIYLDALRQDRGLGILILAHNEHEKVQDPIAGEYHRHAPALRDDVRLLVGGWCDEVLFATRKVLTKTTEAGFNRTISQAVGAGDRIIMAGSANPAADTKNRLNLPEQMPLEWSALAAYLPTQDQKNG